MALRGTSGAFLGVNATVTYLGTSPTPMNGSDQATPENITMGTLISLLLIVIISLLGLAGNAVVLWFLVFRMRRNTFSVYILNLAGADFLLLCCQIIRSLQTLIYYFHSIPIFAPSFFFTIFTFAYITGLSLLSAISTERCLSVLWPIWYRCHRPTHMSAVMCALLWALSLLLSILERTYCDFLFSHLYKVWCQVFDLITAGCLIFLFVFLSGSSLVLVSRLLCGSQRVPLTRPYVIVLLTVLVFLLCGLPWGIHWFLVYWIKKGSDGGGEGRPRSWFSRGLCRTFLMGVNMEEVFLRKPWRCQEAVWCLDSESCFVQTHGVYRTNLSQSVWEVS
ncbi:mas-related G-protein coupled receptor member X2-like isoform 2-T2 [Hipposideros larvatus]